MLETLKSLLDAAKATTYELLALLLPGAVVLAVLECTCGVTMPFGTVGAIAAAYVFGTVLQAVADFVLKLEKVASWIKIDKDDYKPTKAYALQVIQKRLQAAPEAATLDICLTQVGARRTIYDKFIALRDTARGLAFATPIAAVLVICDEWPVLWGGWTACSIAKVAGAVLLSIVLFLAFIQRYARFHPLAHQAVFGQFLAIQLDKKD
jgi:hypothetical protein